MSRESFARGFVKAANAAGVDAVALAKVAWDENGEEYRKWLSSPAGIGTWDQNALETLWPAGRAEGGGTGFVSEGMKPADKGSFMAALLQNAKKDGNFTRGPMGASGILRQVAPSKIVGEPNEKQITNEDIDNMRHDQARLAANRIGGISDENRKSLMKELDAAGKINEASWKSDKVVPNRKLSLPTADRLNLPDKTKAWLRAVQNSMVRNSTGGTPGNIA